MTLCTQWGWGGHIEKYLVPAAELILALNVWTLKKNKTKKKAVQREFVRPVKRRMDVRKCYWVLLRARWFNDVQVTLFASLTDDEKTEQSFLKV